MQNCKKVIRNGYYCDCECEIGYGINTEANQNQCKICE